MTQRFLATTLDLSQVPPPDLIEALSSDRIHAERIVDLKARFAARGIEFDVEGSEADPGVILQETDGYRELLDRQRINDVARRRMLAYAKGTDLEHIGYLFGVQRLVGEDDERLRRRIQLAPDAFSTAAYAPNAYVFHAMTADVRVEDAKAVGYESGLVEPGGVIVAVLTPAATRTEVMANVRARLFDGKVKPLTAVLELRAAIEVPYQVSGTILLADGPDPAQALSAANADLLAYQAKRRRIGATVAVKAIDAALVGPLVDDLAQRMPLANVDPGPLGVAVCTGNTIGWGRIADA